MSDTVQDTLIVFLNLFFKLNLEKISRYHKSMTNYPACKELVTVFNQISTTLYKTIIAHWFRWNKGFQHKIVNIFLPMIFSICFGCSKEQSHWDCSFECLQHGQTWFSCSLYSFHSEQAEQKSSALEHLCWRTPEYSVLRGGVDRTVTWPVPKKMADLCLHARKYFESLDLFRSTPKCPVLLV